MNSVSVIVPIYHGKQYIEELINQLERCFDMVEDIFIELILSNDDPLEPIEQAFYSQKIKILIINSDENKGIQTARIKGLQMASAEYIVFLDQDDKIYPAFFKSQLELIKDADAIVCNCINEGKIVYDSKSTMMQKISKNYMLSVGNSIISPGSVLIKRTSIPILWQEKILKVGGADDYFLWLIMLANDRKFNINFQVLYEHVVDGNNTSMNSLMMFKSVKEMVKELKENEVFTLEETRKLYNLQEVIFEKRILLLDKVHKMFLVLNDVLKIEEDNNIDWNKLYNYKLAIYGNSYLGQRLKDILKRKGIAVECYIDKDAHFMQADIPVYDIENVPDNVNMVINTVLAENNCVYKQMSSRYPSKKIVEIGDIGKLLRE